MPQMQTARTTTWWRRTRLIDVDEECLREAKNTVMNEIGLKHLVMFDIYDVCLLARGNVV